MSSDERARLGEQATAGGSASHGEQASLGDTASAAAIAAIAAVLRSAPSPIILIDGPSGAGKSTFADAVIAQCATAAVELVRMDDLYPGWTGLDAASRHVFGDLIGPLRASGAGRWRRWNWVDAAPAEWHEVTGGHPLVIEGCGCLTRATAPLADLRLWLTADDGVRKRRALTRDDGAFDAHWESWDQQWSALSGRERPWELADLIVDTTSVPDASMAAGLGRGTVGG